MDAFPVRRKWEITWAFGLGFLAIVLSGGESLAADVYLLDGFRFGWRDHPHRINRLGFELLADGTARTELTGGPWSDGRKLQDKGNAHVWRSALDHPAVDAINGSTPWMVSSGRLRSDVAAPATARTLVTVELDTVQTSGNREWVVLLRGLEIDTNGTHTDGLLTKGFGVHIGPASAVVTPNALKTQITFETKLRVEGGRLPLRMRPERYTIRGRIHYTVVGLEAGHITRAAHCCMIRTRGGRNQPLHSAAKQIVVRGQPGYAWGALGLTGFDFCLNRTNKRFGGRYLRDLWVHNRNFVYEPGDGRMTFISDVGFSNRSLWAYDTTTISEANFALLQTSAHATGPPAAGQNAPEQSAARSTAPSSTANPTQQNQVARQR